MTAFLAEKQQGKYLVAYVLNDTIVRNWETPTSVTIEGPNQVLVTNTAGIQLTATVNPELAKQEVVWSSETPTIATVSATGLVTPVSVGNATIKATAKGSTVSGTYTVKVVGEAVPATSITLSSNEESVAEGSTVTLTADVAPANSTDEVIWTSSDDTVATVVDGVVTGVKAGNATITATAGDKTATCAITVTDPFGTADAPISVTKLIALADEKVPNNKDYSDKVVYAIGKVSSVPSYNSKNNNYGFNIVDVNDSSKSFQVYACVISEEVGVPSINDTVVVTGYLNNYNGTKQISYKGSENPSMLSRTVGTSALTVNAEHATVTGIPATAENGTVVEFTVAVDDQYVLDSVKVGNTELTAAEGKYTFTVAGDATITVATHKEGDTAAVTITKTSNEIVEDKNYTVSTNGHEVMYTSLELDSVITVSTTGQPNCGSFWGSTTIDWRLYQAKAGNVVLTAAEGYQLVSATFVFNVSNSGILKHGEDGVESGAVVALSGSSETFVVGGTGAKANGQVRITSFSVTYVAVSNS